MVMAPPPWAPRTFKLASYTCWDVVMPRGSMAPHWGLAGMEGGSSKFITLRLLPVGEVVLWLKWGD